MRIDAILSRFGYCSRSEARAWVKAGRVKIGGVAAKTAAEKADPAAVLVDDGPVEHVDGILALLHKPAGCVCSRDASEGATVYHFLPQRWLKRNPPVTTVGRLDKDTTGALLITDLGEVVHTLTSPRNKVSKIYEVLVDRDLPPNVAEVFASGTLVLPGEEKPCLPAKVVVHSGREARLEIVEGRYHQVKRMFASLGCSVTRLHRSRFGPFTVDDLAPGEWKLLPLKGPFQ